MTYAMTIEDHGGSDQFQKIETEIGSPGEGMIRLKHHAVGLNFIDVYHRTGLYPIPLPSALGLEAAGEVLDIGPGVTDIKIGDRVAYASPPLGAYSDERLMPADRVVKLPDNITYDQAAAMMLQGMTVEYLLCRTFSVKPGDTVLFHAAAGGVGLLACQWLNMIGATVIGTVGSEEKAELAKAHGCHHTILYREENVVDAVKEITEGKGVPVVYDSIGADTYEISLDSLSPRGMLVSFGNASGPVNEIKPGDLASRGSLFFTRPSLMHYTSEREDLVESASKLFEMHNKGLKLVINQKYALEDIAYAHDQLEARKTTGSTILIP